MGTNGSQKWICLYLWVIMSLFRDAKRMAADVNKALEGIAMEHGGLNISQSQAWMKKLKSQGRYAEDVW
jgi:hypothetical protein